jgi:serine/threonine protein kinase
VITYFLLCGYTPFDRESNLEEMQAILAADYSFTPVEYWRGVSDPAREFIKACLTIDPNARMTAHQALQHPWISPDPDTPIENNQDLLPTVKKNFNARRTLHAAIDTIRAINKLREGGGMGMMNGAVSKRPDQVPPGEGGQSAQATNPNVPTADGQEKVVGMGGDAMEIDGRGFGRGQTDDMIKAQERKINETSKGLWQKAGT